MKVYFSDDERHVLVLAIAKVSNGELRVELATGVNKASNATPRRPTSPVVPKPVAKPAPLHRLWPQFDCRLRR